MEYNRIFRAILQSRNLKNFEIVKSELKFSKRITLQQPTGLVGPEVAAVAEFSGGDFNEHQLGGGAPEGEPAVPPRAILHVDADAFFASVEQQLNPRYRGKPLIVAGGVRGVVSSASYEARRFGIHSAMPTYQARKLCPTGIFVSGNFELYSQFSKAMFQIFRNYTPHVEQTSIDEGYLDLTGTNLLHKANSLTIAHRILLEVNQRLGISISGGLSSSMMVSKIAASRFKPKALVWILQGQERTFLEPLPVEVMPGIGPKTLPTLHRMGLYRLGDIAALTFAQAHQMMGEYGIILRERAQGLDSRKLALHPSRRQSISEEKTFPRDISQGEVLFREAFLLLKGLCFRLRKEGLYAKTLTLKIRYGNFETTTHQKKGACGMNDEEEFKIILKRFNRDLLERFKFKKSSNAF
ncbi:MAG: polymerase IV, DNA polymerase IV protein [Candidatus Peregrinibacteria bacterium GW2011_GWE2_39_6]|nr:MAG: polymerase IV, DNA polymerase IV protein [Candidatus Peregrinibacteria bacterium GW2011_GWE2_39_6]